MNRPIDQQAPPTESSMGLGCGGRGRMGWQEANKKWFSGGQAYRSIDNADGRPVKIETAPQAAHWLKSHQSSQ